MKLAAIDIGSNAARLLINEAINAPGAEPEFIKTALVRVPLRLGFDVFETGRISSKRAEKMMNTIKAYKLLMDVYDIQNFKACATSAMRDAANGKEIIAQIEKETGICIKIISGQEEATLIYENHFADHLNKQNSYLYIDVGGGSTELNLFNNGKLVAKESFNIGTIRLLKNLVTEATWEGMKEFVKKNTKGKNEVIAIGTGGNINKVFSLSKKKDGKPLTLELLRDYYREMNALSLTERKNMYKMREDRADVIVPALLIYINVMRWAGADNIYVPKIGLADGLINLLYRELNNK